MRPALAAALHTVIYTITAAAVAAVLTLHSVIITINMRRGLTLYIVVKVRLH